MVKRLLSQYLVKAILVALLALALFGVLPGTHLAVVLALVVILRFIVLATESLRTPMTAERWETRVDDLTRVSEELTSEERAKGASALGLDPHVSPRELARVQVSRAMQCYVLPRQKRELGAEALGVVAFALLLPADIALCTRDFFSFRTPQGWEGAAVAALGLGAYAWPHLWLKPPRFSSFRTLWWALPFAPLLFVFNQAIETRHPYLNPFDPDHTRLAAERVLALKSNIVAGRHADWVLRYARLLDQRGERQQAVSFYRETLRLDANNREAGARLMALETPPPSGVDSAAAVPARAAAGPYWTSDKPVTRSPRCRIDSALEQVEGCTVMIVPVGEVADGLQDAVAHVIRNELDLPVCISTNPVPLPAPTRTRGLITGRQWAANSIIQAFLDESGPFPKSPIKYVLLTPVDIYMDEANYVFSGSSAWGAVVSSARFGGPNGDDSALLQRTAKQTLCALIKSFSVPVSTDRSCVTSYSRTLDEFDAKGNRPNAATLALFRQAVADVNRGWLTYRARQRASGGY